MSGEDGIILHIMDCLAFANCPIYKTCAEFGCADGIWLSNTKKLIDLGWESLQIENNPEKFIQLQENYKDNPRVVCLCASISPDVTSPTHFDNLFNVWNRPGLDVLSIDIDSCDYSIFKTLKVSPSVVLVENNSHQKEYENEGMTTITKLANEKGYSLIGYTCNSIFIKTKLLPFIDIAVVTPKKAWKDYLLNSSEEAINYLTNQLDIKNHWKK